MLKEQYKDNTVSPDYSWNQNKIRKKGLKNRAYTFDFSIMDHWQKLFVFVRRRPTAQRHKSATYLGFHKPASNQEHLLSLQFKHEVKQFPSPRAFCWLQINFHDKCPTMTLPLYLCGEKKEIIMRECASIPLKKVSLIEEDAAALMWKKYNQIKPDRSADCRMPF